MNGDKFIHIQVSLRDRPLVKTVFRISYGRSLNTSVTIDLTDPNYPPECTHLVLSQLKNGRLGANK